MLRISSLFRRVLFWCLQFTCRADLVQLWIEIMVSVDYRPSCLFCKVNDIVKIRHFEELSNGFTPRLHLLKVNYPMR